MQLLYLRFTGIQLKAMIDSHRVRKIERKVSLWCKYTLIISITIIVN
jgi:hypothetical protein